MSYILDALKKADHERNIGEVPHLETAHWGVRRKEGRSQLWIWGVGALLVFNGLLLAVLLDRDEPQVPLNVGQSQRETIVPKSKPVTPVPREPQTPGPSATTRPRVKVSRPVTSPPVRQERPARVQTAPRVSQPAPVSASADEFKIPEWRDMSLEFRSGFSLPRIDVHVYAEDPNRRFIMANLKKYREGETMANGAVLEKIHPGSIQLNYQGTRFRVER